ncbi:hypothetical protein LSH36_557g01041 [Paralvinella palmiformis]|uniref:Uncharacterized protein n=1 Tax=Paralvinella palmiformis TaxID=53620 RepID=A0AAD9J6G4_9ANNE|nr:hypothetical protein LSH36_557g01041 [Paralvinella palmiformis]
MAEGMDFNKVYRINAFEVPGWGYSDFTRTGKLGVWNMSHILESGGRLSSIFQLQSLYSPRGVKVFPVVSAQKTVVSRDLHRLATIQFPMMFFYKIGYIGNTSLSLVFELWHKKSETFLLQTERQYVFIDVESRKTQPLPQYLENIRDQFPRNEFSVKLSSKPTNLSKVYVTMFRITASDLDKNYHTNQSVYYRFSLDAAYEAWKSGFLQNFRADPCQYGAKYFEGKHVRETFVGDQISVSLWEDELDQLTLNFEIHKVVDNAYVMYQKIAFFPLNNSKL